MINKNGVRFLLLAGLLHALALGCASSGKNARTSLHVPPGLDSTTVVKASELADHTFVSAQEEREAQKYSEMGKENLNKVDEFWAFLEQKVKKDQTLSEVEKAQFDREISQGAAALSIWKKLTNDGQDQRAAEAALQHCQQAQQHLEQALRINPFDKNTRMLLSVTYYYLQNIFGMQGNYAKAAEILERLIRIEKGEHELFRLLAENYLALGENELALKNYKTAVSVMIKTSFDAPPDTAKIYYYSYAQGDVYARMYDAANAINTFKVAENFARTEQEKADVENYLKWINWDNGNIRASELWDQVLALEVAKDYDKMSRAAEKLLPMLTTPKARISVEHKLAVAEFEFLGRKDVAVKRMLRVFDTIPPEKIQSPDAEVQPYLNTYGAMLYRLGVEARNSQQKKVSLAYFKKSASFDWDQVAKPCYELVTLLWNNPEQAITYGKKAIARDGGLSGEETCELMSLMTKAHKSAGLYDEARTYFNKWKQCQELSHE